MIRDPQLPELSAYRRVEKRLPLTERFDYGKYVSPLSNVVAPVHRWFRFKESFSPDLLREVLETIASSLGRRIRLLDPFCGVGTSLVAAQEMASSGYEIEAVGVEANPFITFAAKTKVGWQKMDPEIIHDLATKILLTTRHYSDASIPRLSSLTSGRCVSRHISKRIVAIRNAIEDDGNSINHQALLLGLASAIESVSRIRKDGRALRIIERERPNLTAMLLQRWATIADDVKFFQKTLPSSRAPTVVNADGRKLSDLGIGPSSFDLVVTSPPYPNNIDYSEVYKLEAWLLGFLKNQDEFLNLRYSTFRSHPTCRKPELPAEYLDEIKAGRLKILLQPLLRRIQHIPGKWRQRVLLGYFADIWLTLKDQYHCLRNGGFAVIVVANSLHGGSYCPYLIPTDIVVSTIARCIGFDVIDLAIARASKRRLSGNHFLRESVITFKKK